MKKETEDMIRLQMAERLVKQSVLVSAGTGLIPIPIIDLTALTALQVYYIKRLANLYGVEFKKEKSKAIVAALISGIVPVSVSTTTFSMIKFVPIIGFTAGIVTLPIIAGATSFAIGKVFIQHFEAGGTFLDFDPDKVKDYFAQKFEEGKGFVSDFKEGGTKA